MRLANRLRNEKNSAQTIPQYYNNTTLENDNTGQSELNKDYAKASTLKLDQYGNKNFTNFLSHNESPLMPGTPYVSSTNISENNMPYLPKEESKSKSQYGDVDFS